MLELTVVAYKCRLFNLENNVAITKATIKPGSAPRKRRNLLGRRVNLPVGGTLGKNVGTPRWLKAIGRYFAGSWNELRQVHWPTRRATWGLTTAVIVFTVMLVAFILGLDFGFEQLFKRIIL
jgi:preprotein translocase SecE subunit